jgi:ABC-type multidrug transport system permease subunit
LVEIAGATGAEVENVLGAGLPGTLALLGGLAFLIGLIVFGAATMRAGVFPRWAGLLLIVGDVVFGMGSFAGSAAPIFEIVGALITGVALVWLGLSLLSGNAASAAGQPTRVS